MKVLRLQFEFEAISTPIARFTGRRESLFQGILRHWGAMAMIIEQSDIFVAAGSKQGKASSVNYRSPRGIQRRRIAEDAPLGSWTIKAKRNKPKLLLISGAGYKKRFKVKVTGPRVRDRRHSSRLRVAFFAAIAEVPMCITTSIALKALPLLVEGDTEDEFDDRPDSDNEGGDEADEGYYDNDVANEGDAELDGNGRLLIDFEVPPPMK